MTRGSSCCKYFFDRVQEAGVDLFNAAKGGSGSGSGSGCISCM
jgi:hypothetical protein